jgi:hypothetical protein
MTWAVGPKITVSAANNRFAEFTNPFSTTSFAIPAGVFGFVKVIVQKERERKEERSGKRTERKNKQIVYI